MTKRQDREMQISERQLLSMTGDLDEMHRATLPAMHEAAAEWSEQLHDEGITTTDEARTTMKSVGRTTSRRGFLVGAGAVSLGGLLLAACGKNSTTSAATIGGTTTTGGGSTTGHGNPFTGDLAVAALAASLENLAVATYQAGLDAATAGKLGSVPAAIATFATTAQKQHMDHAAAWNSIITNAGKPAISGVDLTVKNAVVTPGFAAVKDAAGLAKFALGLEDAAAATYLNAIQNALTSAGAIKIAATIQPVEMQHAAILHFVLGDYPVPDAFAKTDGARPLSDMIG